MKERKEYLNIVASFAKLLETQSPLIGDCELLPYPKRDIMYALQWLRFEAEEPSKGFSINLDSLAYLITVIARDWHEIDPQDKDAVAEIGKYEIFPEWSLPLKMKYIDEEAASNESLDAWIEVAKDRLAYEQANRLAVSPDDPEYGKYNKIVTREECNKFRAWLREHFNSKNDQK